MKKWSLVGAERQIAIKKKTMLSSFFSVEKKSAKQKYTVFAEPPDWLVQACGILWAPCSPPVSDGNKAASLISANGHEWAISSSSRHPRFFFFFFLSSDSLNCLSAAGRTFFKRPQLHRDRQQKRSLSGRCIIIGGKIVCCQREPLTHDKWLVWMKNPALID